MKNTIIPLACLLFLLSSTLAFAQEGNRTIQKNRISQVEPSSLAYNDGAVLPSAASGGSSISWDHSLGVEGSMYLFDDFTDGKVVLADNTTMDDQKLRYNIYYRQMQFIRDEDTLAFANPDEIDYLTLNDRLFIYTEFTKDGEIADDYFEVLVDNDCRLLYRRMVKYHIAPDEESGKDSKEVFINCCEFYIKKGEQPAIKVALTKKSVLCAFKDKEQEVSAFIKSNRLKMKSKEDLMMVIKFYNSLINA